MAAFLRPVDPYYQTNKGGNVISFNCWRECYENAGLPTPECWDEGLLKPHNHTVSVSDLVFITGFQGGAALRVGEIKRCLQNGHAVEISDGSTIEVDIIIKATGFHLNNDVKKITGLTKIHSNNLLGFNFSYGAEPLLDGGQFGSSKGKMETHYSADNLPQDQIMMGFQKMGALNLDLTPRANAFGSAYVGGMLASAYYFKYLVEHPEHQKAVLDICGEPETDITEMWVSQIGGSSVSS